jgi:hypothetical protein
MRTTPFDKRRDLMRAWAAFVTAKPSRRVVQIRAKHQISGGGACGLSCIPPQSEIEGQKSSILFKSTVYLI